MDAMSFIMSYERNVGGSIGWTKCKWRTNGLFHLQFDYGFVCTQNYGTV